MARDNCPLKDLANLRRVDRLRPRSVRTLARDGRRASTWQTDGLDQHARGMRRDGLHVLDLDVLSAPVVQHQAEYPPADHTADRRRLEIARPDLRAIRRGAGLEADVERFEAGLPIGVRCYASRLLRMREKTAIDSVCRLTIDCQMT